MGQSWYSKWAPQSEVFLLFPGTQQVVVLVVGVSQEPEQRCTWGLSDLPLVSWVDLANALGSNCLLHQCLLVPASVKKEKASPCKLNWTSEHLFWSHLQMHVTWRLWEMPNFCSFGFQLFFGAFRSFSFFRNSSGSFRRILFQMSEGERPSFSHIWKRCKPHIHSLCGGRGFQALFPSYWMTQSFVLCDSFPCFHNQCQHISVSPSSWEMLSPDWCLFLSGLCSWQRVTSVVLANYLCAQHAFPIICCS